MNAFARIWYGTFLSDSNHKSSFSLNTHPISQIDFWGRNTQIDWLSFRQLLLGSWLILLVRFRLKSTLGFGIGRSRKARGLVEVVLNSHHRNQHYTKQPAQRCWMVQEILSRYRHAIRCKSLSKYVNGYTNKKLRNGGKL